jgi:hypothetical protein
MNRRLANARSRETVLTPTDLAVHFTNERAETQWHRQKEWNLHTAAGRDSSSMGRISKSSSRVTKDDSFAKMARRG